MSIDKVNPKLIETYLGDDKENPIQKVYDKLTEAGNFKDNEVGLYSPVVFSNIKLRDNGMIDIFTSGNQGIRIDPKTCSINFFANHIKEHIHDHSVWANNLKYDIDTNITLDIDNTMITLSRDTVDVKLTNGNTVSIKPESMQMTFKSSIVTANEDMIQVQHGNNKITINDTEVCIESNNTAITIRDGAIYIAGDSISINSDNLNINGGNINISGNIRLNGRNPNDFHIGVDL